MPSEIERMLNITITIPQTCHFCTEPITKMNGRGSESLLTHHITYIPKVKVPAHHECHLKYHGTHPEHPKNPEAEYKKRLIESNIMCHFCGEEITKKSGKGSGSLTIHSLDGDHGNWDPENKVPSHHGCHQRYHTEGDKNVSRRPEVRRMHSEAWMGDKNPMKDPEASKKIWKKRRERHGPTGRKPPKSLEGAL